MASAGKAREGRMAGHATDEQRSTRLSGALAATPGYRDRLSVYRGCDSKPDRFDIF
jgi:hypothetical protein